MNLFTRHGLERALLLTAVVAVGAVFALGCGGGGGKEEGGGIKSVSAKKTKRADFKDDKTGIEMVFVKGGAFKMGCTDEQKECDDDEKPVHSVTLGDFLIGKYEVTQKQWFQVMESNPSGGEEGEGLPVNNVSWNDVQEFIKRLNTMTGREYRLPTEAEWEFAARGGIKSKGNVFAGSNNPDDVAWYKNNSGGKTHPIGTKAPNELGLYDMSGNVWEWVSDWKDKYSSFDIADPKGPVSGSSRVFRGGGWSGGALVCRVSFRNYYYPDIRRDGLGFRLALSPQ
jgi:formylglycine-generating enzyme required for sulfatase activity